MPNKIKKRQTKAEIEQLMEKIYEILEKYPRATQNTLIGVQNSRHDRKCEVCE